MLNDFELTLEADKEAIEVAPIELPHRFRPYPHQKEILDVFFDMLESKNTIKRYALEFHRRAGKDVSFFQLVVAAALMVRGDYCYMLPKQNQAKKVVWNGNVQDSDGNVCNFSDFIPPNCLAKKNNTESRFELSNGSNIYVMGSDNYDNAVGMNAAGVVYSEWSLCDPRAYDYFAPMLRRNAQVDSRKGWALFCWTPRGKNHAWETRNKAQMEVNKGIWYFSSKTIDDTADLSGRRLITDEDIQEELNSGADPDLIKQEYYLDYDAAVKGIIYGKQMETARKEGRVRKVPINPDVPVLTFWDIGVNDATAIWFLQPNPKNEELNLINYYENSDEGVDHYVSYLKEFSSEHNVKLGEIYLPHDGRNKEWISGERRHEVLMNKGFSVTVIPRTKDINEAISQTKTLFKRFVFDEQKCYHGITCLDNYRWKINDQTGALGTPLHDTFSNGADALRQVGQYYADKYISKAYDSAYVNEEQHKLNVLTQRDHWGESPSHLAEEDDYDPFDPF